MKIKPLFDRVLIKNVESKSQTKSGIFIPETVGD
jgi:co-chaperonin GroES (HSP10)